MADIDPNVLAAIISGGMNLGGGILNGIGTAQMTAAQMAAQAAMAQANASQNQFNQQQGQAQAGLNSTQMDPLLKAKSESQMAVRNAMLGAMSGGQFKMPSQFDPATLAASGQANQLASETNFYNNVANTSPNSPTPDLSLLYGDAGKNAMTGINATQTAAQGRLTSEQTAVSQALAAAANGGDDGSGVGAKTAASILGIGAPIAAKLLPNLLPSAAKTTAQQVAAYINPGAAAPAAPAPGGGVSFGAGGSGGGSGGGDGYVGGAYGDGSPGDNGVGSDPTQPGGAQGQGFGIGLPYHDAYGGSGGEPVGASGQQGSGNPNFPALHKGGIVHGPGGTDNVLARLTRGEGVITQPAMQRLGGAQALNQINRPMPPAAPPQQGSGALAMMLAKLAKGATPAQLPPLNRNLLKGRR